MDEFIADELDDIVQAVATYADGHAESCLPSEALEVFERLAMHFANMADGMRSGS